MEPPAEVQRMFARIAGRYDLANTVLSGGLDFFWRRRAAIIVRGWQPASLLDLATGSGVLAATLARTLPGTSIVGADFCLPMLQRAKALRRLPVAVTADAMHLPFRDGTFDVVTVAFGLRNMPSYAGALREMRRVLREGGHVLILDFSLPTRWWQPLYCAYLHRVLPRVARLVSGERGAYDYLAESIERFPSGAAMGDLLRAAGFAACSAQELTGGIVSLYTASAAAIPASSGNCNSSPASA